MEVPSHALRKESLYEIGSASSDSSVEIQVLAYKEK